MKPHRNHQVTGKKWTWNWHKTLCCAQESALLPLSVMLPNSSHILHPLLCCSTVMQLMCCCLTASTAGYKERAHLTRCISKARPVKCKWPLFQFMCLFVPPWRTVLGKHAEDRELLLPALWCYRKWIFLFCYPPRFYLGRALLPAESWTRDRWR